MSKQNKTAPLKTVGLSVRISEELKNEIIKAARRSDRDMSKFVIHALRAAVLLSPADLANIIDSPRRWALLDGLKTTRRMLPSAHE